MHRWTSTDHVTLSLSKVMSKQTSSLVVERFDWRHVLATAVKRNGRMRRLVTFFCRVVLQTLYKKFENYAWNGCKNENIETELHC